MAAAERPGTARRAASSYRAGESRWHFLGTEEGVWDAARRGDVSADFRPDGRYDVGDLLILHRGVEPFRVMRDPQPRLLREVTHVVRGPAAGVPEGFAVLSTRPFKPLGAGDLLDGTCSRCRRPSRAILGLRRCIRGEARARRARTLYYDEAGYR